MRKFSLTNTKGSTISLQSRDDILLYGQTGLGYSEELDFFRVNNNHVLTSRKIDQHTIKAKLVFSGEDYYKKYHDFVKFCQNAPMVLSYTTYDTFYIKVRLAEITKTQGVSNMHMLCDVTFVAYGLFYRIVSRHIEPVAPSVDDVYPYVYDDVYPAEAIGAVMLESDGTEDSPTKITIFGEAVNPVWRHYLNGKLVASGSYEGAIAAGHKLVIDATTIPYSIIEYDGNSEVVADRYALCDFSTDRFFYLKNGKNSISVSHDGVNGLALTVEGRVEYASV